MLFAHILMQIKAIVANNELIDIRSKKCS